VSLPDVVDFVENDEHRSLTRIEFVKEELVYTRLWVACVRDLPPGVSEFVNQLHGHLVTSSPS
jgi:hypothetical protein